MDKLISEHNPDILLLQEIKCTEDKFPYLELESYNYNVAIAGQKTFNGVAIMSKSPIEDVVRGIPNYNDDQARYIECVTTIGGVALRVASVYVPNGQSVGSEKFAYKLDFLHHLQLHLENLHKAQEVCLVGGDYNIAPEEIDVFDPYKLEGSIGFHLEERKLLRSIINSGYYDSYRVKHPKTQAFSWWDYRGRSHKANEGMRIDHILTSPEATDLLYNTAILQEYRALDKTSDHAPLLCELAGIS